jgi:hypothetical protein
MLQEHELSLARVPLVIAVDTVAVVGGSGVNHDGAAHHDRHQIRADGLRDGVAKDGNVTFLGVRAAGLEAELERVALLQLAAGWGASFP